MALRRSPDLAWQVIGDEAVVMNLAGARAVGLNPVGALVFSLLEERDAEGPARAVCERFDATPERARADVKAFLADLVAHGLVVEG
jgi:hypothetical protein